MTVFYSLGWPSNIGSSCLHLGSVGITSMLYHIWLYVVHARQALSTEPHPYPKT